MWPSENAELKIEPNTKMPMTMAQSVQSGMNFKLPITLKFPSFYDVMRPIRVAAMAAAASDPVMTMPSNTRDEKVTFANTTKATARTMFYKTIESSHPKFGKVCLLRAICEVAETPAINSGSGIIGELVDLLLT
ncbi:hypothetical protein HDE_02975 [Halotydeus destructor]|nr:hypothetical protein HDE_02975 [Halotydeus destructor]